MSRASRSSLPALVCEAVLASAAFACGGQVSVAAGNGDGGGSGGHDAATEGSKDASSRPDAGLAPLDWRHVSSSGPSARILASMTYDSDRKVTVLFGGMDTASGNALSDTWEWNGTSWTRRNPLTPPAARFGSAFSYDSTRHAAVLFSGDIDDLPPPPVAADTWTWDGTNWTQESPSASPPALEFGAMAFDSDLGLSVLYTGLGTPNDPWELGTTWSRESPDAVPAARTDFALAYDSRVESTVLFGGLATASGNGPVVSLGDTWSWKGTSWTKLPATPRAPSARSAHAMAYDASRARIVLFGGIDAADNPLSDTWEFDGATWTEATPATHPPPTSQHAMAYDSDRQVIVMFGGNVVGGDGFPDTWEASAP
jgi:hypothetical protein